MAGVIGHKEAEDAREVVASRSEVAETAADTADTVDEGREVILRHLTRPSMELTSGTFGLPSRTHSGTTSNKMAGHTWHVKGAQPAHRTGKVMTARFSRCKSK